MLHPYATDSDERKQIPLYLAGFAIVSAIALSWVLQKLHWPGWLDAPATAGFYGLYYELFRHRLWKAAIFRKWGCVRVPVLAGRWKGHVVTSFDEAKGKHSVTATILQDWTHMQVRVASAYSKSKSIVGTILTSDEIVVDYEYKNEPLPGAVETMHAHRGTASLVLSSDGQQLSGDYYSGRDRQNFGSLHLEKVD
jgi:hypothetical protein